MFKFNLPDFQHGKVAIPGSKKALAYAQCELLDVRAPVGGPAQSHSFIAMEMRIRVQDRKKRLTSVSLAQFNA